MHLLALTAGAALASIAPVTAPPGEPSAPPDGAVPAGTYAIEDSFAGAPFTVTLTLPEGWTYISEFSFLSGPDYSYIVPISLESMNLVPTDNCAWAESEVIAFETAAEFAAALAEQHGSMVSAPQPLQIGAHTGVVFNATLIPAAGDCDSANGNTDAGGEQMVFMDENHNGWWYHGDGIFDVKTFRALDFEFGVGIIEIGAGAPLRPDQQRELLAIIDSIDVVENT
jgi:hypothetical protein